MIHWRGIDASALILAMRGRGFVNGLVVVLAMSGTAGAPAPAWAWGHEGHRLVAKIAAKRLQPGVDAKVAAILGTSVAGLPAAMADAATWPDDIRDKEPGPAGWHFINAPVFSPSNFAR